MKCVKKEGKKIRRVSDEKAMKLVDEHGWEYCPKHEWKSQERTTK
ncbi:MAG: hypothetical protein ACFFG0_00555 [Candidatus Thorarchaeota archaeon]